MALRSSCPVHEIPVSLWSELKGKCSVVPDRCQVTLYQQIHLRFITAVFQICPAYIDGGGEIDFMVMLCFF